MPSRLPLIQVTKVEVDACSACLWIAVMPHLVPQVAINVHLIGATFLAQTPDIGLDLISSQRSFNENHPLKGKASSSSNKTSEWKLGSVLRFSSDPMSMEKTYLEQYLTIFHC